MEISNDSERKDRIKQLYGVEDNQKLTKALERLGLEFDAPIRWDMVGILMFYHVVSFYGLFTLRSPGDHWKTMVWGVLFAIFSGFGLTAGAHRLWAHKAYSANFPLKVILFILFTSTGHNTLYEWVRDHRVHHKFTETDSDPHNIRRGVFYAHIGWYMLEQHPDVKDKERKIDMSDVEADSIVWFHQKYHEPLKLLMCFVLPTLVPVYFWNEGWTWSFLVNMIRYISVLHITWSTNSVAHTLGGKPYDKSIKSVENKIIAFLALGEGWHNYHHTFPWDYKTSELGFYQYNLSTMFIDFFAKIGWAYDLRQPSREMIDRTLRKHGDGTHSRVTQQNDTIESNKIVLDK